MGALVQLTEEQRKINNRVTKNIRLLQKEQQERRPLPQIQSRSPVVEEDQHSRTADFQQAVTAPEPAQPPPQPEISHSSPASEPEPQAVPAIENHPMYFSPMPPVPIFKGGNGGKHPVKFIGELETYFKKMNIPAKRQLEVVSEALVDAAQDWASIFKGSWLTFADFRKDFLESYWSEQEQNKLRNNISTTRWSPVNRCTMEAHFARYIGLARMLTKPIPEDVLVAELIKHFPVQIQSLWTLKTDKTTASAAEFLRQQENIGGSHFTEPPTKRFRPNPGHNYPQNPSASGNDRRSSQ